MALTNGSAHSPEPELHLILPNTLYLTFNAPTVNEYHRGIFLTYPPPATSTDHPFSGTLFHAAYAFEPKGHHCWTLENRIVQDLSTSKSLVLFYRIHSYDETEIDMLETHKRIDEVLKSVPLGKEARVRELGEVEHGNPVLGGYDCVIWTHDALEALVKAGLADLKGKSAAEVMAHARAAAGPEDAKTMVGVDVGGFKVIN